MQLETITDNERLVIRRMILNPGESSCWHSDSCKRFSVIIRGSRLAIQFRDTGEIVEFAVSPGMTGWDDPEPRVHQATNRGADPYEEVVTFHRQSPDIDPQPGADTS